MSADPHSTRGVPFRLGVNYWPARTAMGWWTAFDPAEVAADFGRIAGCGFDSVRIFLTWEDFQPTPSRVESTMVDRLVSTLDEASNAGLSVMPTLFTGHMSGVNWIPSWALREEAGNDRFRVVSGGRVAASRIANWYSDASVVRAQSALAREVAGALAGHRALWAWDLGNENSNCAVPPDKAHAREWLLRVTDAIRAADPRALVTLGLHMEDLEQDRNLGPREAAEVCDFLQMHGYPGYAGWADGPTDERVLPFLARLTRWLSGGADVLFAEFGVPTTKPGESAPERSLDASGPALVEEQAAASYIERALAALLECGSTGALLWCYSDYVEAIWGLPPLDLAVHERSFGLWRADASPKPAVAVVAAFAKRCATPLAESRLADSRWIDVDAAEFYRAPASELPRLYRRYCEAIGALEGPPANVNEPG
ncbi:MAG: cellulase family glycosylhydrolase [Deltaproteobacteria bacterium]